MRTFNEGFAGILDSSNMDYAKYYGEKDEEFADYENTVKTWLYACIEDCSEGSYEIVPYDKDDIYCINVFRDINIMLRPDEDKIPYKFNYVKGDFNCSFCGLTSLENAPDKVDGVFNCSFNNLKNLDFIPDAKRYNLSFNNLNLSSLNRIIDKKLKWERHTRHNKDPKKYENGIDSDKSRIFTIYGNPRLIKYMHNHMYNGWIYDSCYDW